MKKIKLSVTNVVIILSGYLTAALIFIHLYFKPILGSLLFLFITYTLFSSMYFYWFMRSNFKDRKRRG